jgi:hypothetical protein
VNAALPMDDQATREARALAHQSRRVAAAKQQVERWIALITNLEATGKDAKQEREILNLLERHHQLEVEKLARMIDAA